MMLRRLSWARLTRSGIPPLFVLRPWGKLTPPEVGEEYPAPEPANKVQITRARQLYEQRRICTKEEIDNVVAAARRRPVKEKKNGHRSSQNHN